MFEADRDESVLEKTNTDVDLSSSRRHLQRFDFQKVTH